MGVRNGMDIVMADRPVCGWCPMQLPDSHEDWYLHFLVEHGIAGYSVRFYPTQSLEDELEELLGELNPTQEDK